MRFLVVGEPGLEPVAQTLTIIQHRAERCARLLFAARDHDFEGSLKENNACFRALEQDVANGCSFYRAAAHSDH
jgi:hypothetical protein